MYVYINSFIYVFEYNSKFIQFVSVLIADLNMFLKCEFG